MADVISDPYLVLAKIWGRATGGSDVAVDPDTQLDSRFTVDPASGVKEACTELRARVDTAGLLQMVFLVGGPGGGKSHALRELTHGLSPTPTSGRGVAQRAYSYRTGGQCLRVVNDASIPAGITDHSLSDDIDQAIRNSEYLLACVNRGILVEEASAVTHGGLGAAVIHWLADPEATTDGHLSVQPHDQGSVQARANLTTPGRTIELVAVHVDMCSLFEPRPETGANKEIGPYKVLSLAQRKNADLQTVPAGALLSKVINQMTETNTDTLHDPILANIQSLSSETGRRGLLTTLRSTEAVAGARLGFREVWGSVVRALAGDAPSEMAPEEVRNLFPNITTADPHARFAALRARARYRYSQAIFGVDATHDRRSGDPILRLTMLVDPVLDAIPGHLQQKDPGGWASPVLDAFSGLVTSASPLDTLKQALPETDGFHQVVTQFDRELDSAFLAASRPGKLGVSERRKAVSWYGDYLCRLYAVSNGVTAFRDEVAVWLKTRTRTELPTEISDALKTLLRPWSDPENPLSDYLLPLFSSRSVPITGPSPDPRLVMKGGSGVTLKCESVGDRAIVIMNEEGVQVGEIELDFSLIRTAMSCNERRLGVTERSAAVGPRVERFRAKRLTSARVAESSLRVLGPAGAADVVMEN